MTVTIATFPARLIAGLPAPWRMRLRIGETVIDCTSSNHEPSGWCRTETLYVLVAALEDRLSPETVARSAASRVRKAIDPDSRATWHQVSGGLAERYLLETRGTVGEALRKVGAELVGEWSGDAAEVVNHAVGDGTGRIDDRVRVGRSRARRGS